MNKSMQRRFATAVVTHRSLVVSYTTYLIALLKHMQMLPQQMKIKSGIQCKSAITHDSVRFHMECLNWY